MTYEDGRLVFWSFDCWVFFGIVFVVVGFLGVGVGNHRVGVSAWWWWSVGEEKKEKEKVGGGFG